MLSPCLAGKHFEGTNLSILTAYHGVQHKGTAEMFIKRIFN